MALPAILSVLLGLVLAQRFKVFVLLPVILLVLTFSIAGALAHVETAVISVVTAMVAIVSLQIGYLLGIVVRHARASLRAHRPGSSLPRLPHWRAH
jgi:hypothetical protein